MTSAAAGLERETPYNMTRCPDVTYEHTGRSVVLHGECRVQTECVPSPLNECIGDVWEPERHVWSCECRRDGVSDISMPLPLIKRIDQRESLTNMDRGHSVIGGRRDSKAERAIMHRTENFMDVGSVRTIETEEKPTIVIPPVPIELQQQAMGLCTRNEIVMQTDPLPRDKFMRCDIYTRAQIHLKQLCQPSPDGS